MGQNDIFNFLKANMGVWFTIEQIARINDMQVSQASKCLNKMLNYDGIYGLEYKHEPQGKTGSNRVFTIKYYRVRPGHIPK